MPIKQLPVHKYLIIYTTTQLKLKRKNTDGTPEKYKARTCARGDMFNKFAEITDTYSPTISPLTFSSIF